MEKIALILSIVSLIISCLSYTRKIEKEFIIEKPTIKKMGAILFKNKKPEQIRMEKKLKQGRELNIDELC